MKTNKVPEDILDRDVLKNNPFGVPEGYFRDMKQEVMDKIAATRIAEEDMAPAEPATFFTYLKPALSLAAVFATMIFNVLPCFLSLNFTKCGGRVVMPTGSSSI